MEAYSIALAQLRIREIGKDRSVPGTLSAAIGGYYTHNSFLVLSPSTRQARRAVLERLRKAHGDKPLALIERRHIAAILGKLKPYTAHNWLRALRGLMRFAVEIGLRRDDPTTGIERAKATAGTIHTWSENEIAQYEQHWPVGSKPRLAMALLLYTAQRRSDVIQMGPQYIRNGMIYVRPQKTKRHGTELVIPLHPELARIIAATKCGNLAFLTTEAGAAYTNGTGLGNRFRRWCDEAGLPQCSAHGLRKAACRRLAEAGCTAHEIMAISGHKTLAEAQRYTAAADQARLAHQAVGKIIVPEPKDGA